MPRDAARFPRASSAVGGHNFRTQPRQAELIVVDKVTSPAGEEFELADESVSRVLVKGVVAVLDHRSERLYSVKEGEMFLFADAAGNLDAEEAIGAGLYYKDTRFLSDYVLTVDGRSALLLSTSADRPYVNHVDLANQDLAGPEGSIGAVQGTIDIRRTRVIQNRLYERIRIKNYNATKVTMTIGLTFGSDFADIFEVRGLKRGQRGKLALPKADRRSAASSRSRNRSTAPSTSCAAPMRSGSAPAPASGPTTSSTTRCSPGRPGTFERCGRPPGTVTWWRRASPGSWRPSAATRW